MGLNNTNDSTIKDLKATFFDVFCEHTEELANLITVLATDENVDVVQVESLIFQRIIMLNKTAGNVRMLSKNVDDLSLAKGSYLNNRSVVNATVVKNDSMVNEETVSSNTSVVVPTDSVEGLTSVVAPSTVAEQVPTTTPVQVPTTAPMQVPTTAPVQVPTTAPMQVPTTAPVSEVESVQAPTTAPAVVQPTTTPPLIPVKNNEQNHAVLTTTPPKKSLTQTLMQNAKTVQPKNNGVSAENKIRKLIKTNDNKVKAILVNDKQYNKLRASSFRQAKLLDFGISSGSAPTREKIEELMKKASALYKDGKISEAQALYAEISSLNKELNKNKEKNAVLIKTAA